MKILRSSCLLAALVLVLPGVRAQAPAPTGNFQIKSITKNLITSPQYTYTGAQQYTANQRDNWLEIEVVFASSAEFSDDVTFKYYVAINNKVLTGEVTHSNIAAGSENRSVMYVPPKVLIRFNNGRPVTTASIQNIAVQIAQQGAVKDEASLTRAAGKWYTTLPQVPGLLLNKDETPFAPLYWDRYEQIKAPGH
jgi:hypothetical protein